MNQIITKLQNNKMEITDNIGGKAYGENEIAEINGNKIYFYNTLTRICGTDVEKWLKQLFENEPVTINRIKCFDEDYWEMVI